MNELEDHILLTSRDPVKVMNALQYQGIVSDNAVMPCDVSDSDCEKAIRWLENISV